MRTMHPNKRIHTTSSFHGRDEDILQPSCSRLSPQTKKEEDRVDDFISSKLNSLSLEERSDALNDVHGITTERNSTNKSRWGETPKGINTKSQEMNKALSVSVMTMKDDQTIGFRRAAELSPPYVDQMKTRFIRSSSTPSKICQQAAKTMIKFFNLKYQLFGEEKLVQDIRMNDLRDEERDALQKGLIQLLPYRDRAGRAVMLYDGRVNELFPSSKNDMVIRVLFYFFMATLNDEETQKNGTVLIYYGVGQKISISGRAAGMAKLTLLPIRFVALHYCKSGDNYSNVLNHAIRYWWDVLESKFLCRVRFHSGSHVECIYFLMTFGIPKDAIPFNEDGLLDLCSHQKILGSLRQREDLTNEPTSPSSSSALKNPSSGNGVATVVTTTSGANCEMSSIESSSTTRSLKNTTSSASILIPGPLDIIAGRGRHSKSCMGALRMQNLLLEHRDEYNDDGKETKNEIVDLVLLELKGSGCRFLTLGPSGFIECNDEISREKIARGFRNLRIKEKTKGKKRDLGS